MTNPAPVSRLVILGPPRSDRDGRVRRLRLARVTLDRDDRPRDGGFAHLRRSYD